MFLKAQMKLFAMIISILLAVFIALLSLLNVVTKAVMRGQSKETLMQIAAGIEYNEKSSTFTFTNPGSMEPGGDKRGDQPPPEPSAPSTGAPSSNEPDTTDNTTGTEAVLTDPPYEPDTDAEPEYPEPPEQPDTEPDTPAETDPPHEDRPHETQPTAPPERPDDNKNPGGDNKDPQWGWGDNQNPWGGDNQNPQWGWGDNQNPWGGGYQDPHWGWGNGWYNPWGWWNWNDPQINDNENKDYKDKNEEKPDRSDDGGSQPEGIAYYGDEMFSGGIMALANTVKAEAKTTAAPTATTATATTTTARPATTTVSGTSFWNDRPIRKGLHDDMIPKELGAVNIDFFAIMADTEGKYLATLNNDELGSDKAQKYITDVLDKDIDTGMMGSYQFYQSPKTNGTIMVFTDKSAEMDMLSQLKRTTILIGSIAFVILAAAAYFLSKKSIQPIKIAFDKQKQFVSDASHELKTPLTVISANADVLSGEIGDNKWLTYIKAQTDRMNVLVNDLLNLTRLENNTTSFIRTDFDMSKAVINTALPFECQAFESHKKFEVNVEDGIIVNGSEYHLKQMAAIFIDNALKYSDDGGTVRVSLKKIGEKKVLSVYNTGKGVKESEKDKIFERFFRSDESRNRATGGYGLGLAIAKSIIDKHKFKVHVMNQAGKSICFMVTM